MKTRYFYITILLFIGLCHGVSPVTTCTERGRFPNDENQDCRGYVICLIGGITNFTQYKLTCPQGSIYSHLEQKCTNATNYKCHPNFNCTTMGNFINPESDDCSSFISCVQGMGDMATARLLECPDNTIFNSTNGECIDKNKTACYTTFQKNVTNYPVELPSIDNNVNGDNHKDVHYSNAVSNNRNIISLVSIFALLMIVYL